VSLRIATVATFLALIVAANSLTTEYGLIPVGFGLMATAGTWAAGLVFLLRDLVHDTAGRTVMFACIVVGAALSALLAAPQIAFASGVAFGLSELLDWAVYAPLRKHGWARAVVPSNIAGAFLDTVVFLGIAGFPIWSALPGQMLVKTAATLAVVVPVVMVRALLRQPKYAEGA
jgi:hypothetical protein